MKRSLVFLVAVCLALTLVSCNRDIRAVDMLEEFCELYGCEGVIYSPERAEGEDGYMREDLFHAIYTYHGTPPKSYAVMLNSHTQSYSECGVFICRDTAELSSVKECVIERQTLLMAGESAVISISGNILFYSTFGETDKVLSAWKKIISSYT